jgi:large subunit ribosomal protein L21e
MQKSKGKMGGESRQLKKSVRERGAPAVTQYLQKFSVGQTVHIDIVSSEPSGMPDPKFQGKTGKVKGLQGKDYLVEVSDGKAVKTLIVDPVHLKAAAEV